MVRGKRPLFKAQTRVQILIRANTTQIQEAPSPSRVSLPPK